MIVDRLGGAHSRRIVHFHIPKTAGNAVTRCLAEGLDVRSRRLVFQPGGRVTLNEYGRMRRSRAKMIRLARGASYVSGHFHWETYEEMRPRDDDFLVTFLRDPIDRLRSFFRYVRSRGECMKLTEFLSPSLPSAMVQIDNSIVRLLAGCSGTERHADSEWRRLTERAIGNLERFRFVGFTERIDADLPQLFELPRLPPLTDVPAVNVTPSAARRAAQADEELESERVQSLLEARTHFDRIVFEHALSLRHPAPEAVGPTRQL